SRIYLVNSSTVCACDCHSISWRRSGPRDTSKYRVLSYYSMSKMIDWEAIRREFPVTSHLAYLNSAAAGPVSRKSSEAAAGYYEKMMRDGDVHWNRASSFRSNRR